MPSKANSVSDKDYPWEFLICRDMRHPWDPVSDWNITYGTRKQVVEFTRTSKCMRCAATKHEVIEVPSMRTKSSKIDYPDGYLQVAGKATKQDIRMAMLRQMGISKF